MCVWGNTWKWWYIGNAGKFHLWVSNKGHPTGTALIPDWFIVLEWLSMRKHFKVQSELSVWSMAKEIFLWTIITKLDVSIEFFRYKTKLAIMPILTSETLLRENKNNPVKNVPPVGIEPGPLITSDSKSNTILSGLSWHLLVRLRL